jgi:hypothetical protein
VGAKEGRYVLAEEAKEEAVENFFEGLGACVSRERKNYLGSDMPFSNPKSHEQETENIPD